MFDGAETIGRTAEETAYRRQPLPAGTTAFVRVRSYSGTGEDRLESGWSTHVTGTTDQPMPPATPANLQVGACGEGCLEWTWDEVEGADGYDVQYSLDDERFTDQDATAEVAATETSYRLTNLAADMDVYLRVRSFAGSGADRLESGWSTHATGMTEAPPPMAPAAPTGVEASAGDDFIEWNWNAVSGAEGYEVQISEDSQFTASDATRDVAAALSFRQGDLDYDTRRYLRVRAYIGSGADRLSSDWSADATAVTSLPPPPPPSPGVPSGLTATGGEDLRHLDLARGRWRGRIPDPVQRQRGVHVHRSDGRRFRRDSFLHQGGARGRHLALPPGAFVHRSDGDALRERLVLARDRDDRSAAACGPDRAYRGCGCDRP